jgi:hypothetical protein
VTHVHIRGDFLNRGEEVQPGVLHVLNPLQPGRSAADRLDLARWIVSPVNPLTARVAVNHVWQHLLGRGIVNTVEEKRSAMRDSYVIRRAALQGRIALYTTLAGARAACTGMQQSGEMKAYNVQELHARLLETI